MVNGIEPGSSGFEQRFAGGGYYIENRQYSGGAVSRGSAGNSFQESRARVQLELWRNGKVAVIFSEHRRAARQDDLARQTDAFGPNRR